MILPFFKIRLNYDVLFIMVDVCDVPIHTSIISRRLKERGIHGRVPAVKEFLTADHKAQ